MISIAVLTAEKSNFFCLDVIKNKLAGALADPADGAVLVFKADGPDVALEFAQNDPYVKNGLITDWHVRQWSVVIGNE